MPIILRKILLNKKLASGYRVVLEYTFSDGTVIEIKCNGKSEGDAAQFLISKESQVLSSKVNNDIDTLINNDSDTATSDVEQLALDKEWLKRGVNSDDPIYAYEHLSKVAQKILGLNLTNQELANLFGEPVETIEKTLSKWSYLDTNKDAILQYKTIVSGM